MFSNSRILPELSRSITALRKRWVSLQRWIDAWWGYDVFIAHRRADAAGYAGALHSRLGAEKISSFIDRVVYGPGDSLLIATERHVTKSTVFLLVGSPELLKPRRPTDWVEKEIQSFLATNQSDPKIILVDFGNVVEDGLARQSSGVTPDNAILKQLAPFLRLPEPLDALGMPPSDEVLAAIRRKLDGRRRDRTRLWFFEAASAVLALLLIAAVALGVAAEFARQRARAQAFGSAAYAYSERDPTVALRLAQEAATTGSNTAAKAAALRAFNLGSWFYGHRFDGARDAALSADETQLAWLDGSLIHIRDLASGRERTWASDATDIVFSPMGTLATWKGSVESDHGNVTIWGADGAQRKIFNYDFFDAIDCGGDTIVFWTSVADPNSSSRELRLHVIDTTSESERIVTLPAQRPTGQRNWGFAPGNAACTTGGEVIAAGGRVFRRDSEPVIVDIPEKYDFKSVDVSVDKSHVAVYLRGSVRGVKDAVGIVELIPGANPGLVVVPLIEERETDSGGSVRFLDNNRILAASTVGWNRVVNVKTHAVTEIPSRQRAADAIDVTRTTGDFAVARRSGLVTIYDKSGFPIGRLVGNSPSDGLNPAFTRVRFGSTGNLILTVARDGARLWRRPRNPLVVAGRELDAEAPAQFTQLFATDPETHAESCQGFGPMVVVDDSGSSALCLNLNGRDELLATGMTKEEFSPTLTTKVGRAEGVAVWDDGRHLRLFAVDPDRVMAYVSRSDEIWSPDPNWLEQLIK